MVISGPKSFLVLLLLHLVAGFLRSCCTNFCLMIRTEFCLPRATSTCKIRPYNDPSTINDDNGQGMYLAFTLAAGSNLTTTDNTSWGAYSAGKLGYGHSTAANAVMTTTNATWQVTGVQLEVGPQSTPFEHEPYDTTIRKCGRYYQRISADAGFDYGTVALAIGSTGPWYVPMPLKYGDMRADPTLSYSAVGDFRITLQHSGSATCTSMSIGYNHTDRPMLSVQAGSSSAGSIKLFGFAGASSG